jgi:hypothetical protein
MARALVQVARYTGDRERDVPEDQRRQVAEWLEGLPQPERFQELLNHPESTLQEQEQAWVFGEALPSGLVLSS